MWVSAGCYIELSEFLLVKFFFVKFLLRKDSVSVCAYMCVTVGTCVGGGGKRFGWEDLHSFFISTWPIST